jgi:hypothetical protein
VQPLRAAHPANHRRGTQQLFLPAMPARATSNGRRDNSQIESPQIESENRGASQRGKDKAA